MNRLKTGMLAMALFAACAHAGDTGPVINAGDTAFVLISAALVLLMTPALAFFYGGLVRRKNVLGVLMQCFTVLCVVSLQWVLFGYSLAFHPGTGFWGGFAWAGLMGVGQAPEAMYAGTIPHLAFMIFQAMFAVITPALIIGAFAERMKFSTFLVFTILWTTLVYDPVCHWVWGVGGWLRTMGTLDFAGGTVVHILSGTAALATAIIIGKRRKVRGAVPPHNLPFSVLGAGLLWFGWFGFNAGSALSAGGLAAQAFVTTNTATAAAGLTYMLLEWIGHRKPTVLGTITGAVAGLVAITPACGFVGVMGSMAIGVGAAVVSYVMIVFVKHKLGYDDALDAFGCHGIGGIWGSIATGLFATTKVNPLGLDGLFYGRPEQLLVQLIAVGVTIAFSGLLTFIILKAISLFTKLRATEAEEDEGLDFSLHGEDAYPDFSNEQGMAV